MNNLQIFNSDEFGEIRTVLNNETPMFCLSDVCKALGLSQPSKVNSIPTLTKGGMQNLLYIDESNLYKTIFQSRKESAERFTDWVTSKVLPSIRKHGGYISGQESMTDDELLAKALLVAQSKIAERDRLIAEKQKDIERMRPKEIFADAVASSKQSILIGQLAKLICQNGCSIGQQRLFKWLRENGYLMKCGDNYNMPMQRYVEQGLFEVKESSVTNPDGSVRLTRTTKVTGKGQQYFINKFLKGVANEQFKGNKRSK